MSLPSYAEALQKSLDLVDCVSTEQMSLTKASGRVLASELPADRDYPPFDRAQMDGYALRSTEYQQSKAWFVSATVAAGGVTPTNVPVQACVKIATGAVVPAGLDVVIEHEKSDRADPVRFTVESVEPWRSIHRRGADARAGNTVLAKGSRLGPVELGIAAMVGATTIPVYREPRVVIVTSGDEVVPTEANPATHQIRNSNELMLSDAFRRFGAQVTRSIHLADDAQVTNDTIESLLRDEIDLLVTVGGVSAGERDYFPEAFARQSVKFALRGAAIQPGRPVAAGRGRSGPVVLCLPGNPVSALVCAHLFGWPIVKRMSGEHFSLPWCNANLGESVKPNPQRQVFRPASIVAGKVVIPRWAGSGDLTHASGTHGLVELPIQAEVVEAGRVLLFLAWA